MASSDEDERDDFVALGTPVPEAIEGEDSKKPTTIQDLTARDKQGRRRFHGAFTGGFSAGYFNTVGTKEGFTPSTFVSSKNKKTNNDGQDSPRPALPEDYMDDEDLEEHGIAPRKFATAGAFTSEERKRKRVSESRQTAVSSVLDVGGIFSELLVPDQLTVGIRLLRKMGWRDGQGLGPRTKQKKKKKKIHAKPGVRIYGCALPPSGDEEESEEDFVPEDMSSVTFAPKDVTPISVEAKENVHGLGYHGLDPSLALTGSHINLFSAPVHSKAGRKRISGQAFGVGAFEDEDDDIYAQDNLSNYDITMQSEEEGDNKFGWTAPRDHGKQNVPVTYVGKLLEGFCLSKKQLEPKKKFPPPALPCGFRPHHWFRKQRQMSHIPEHLREDSKDSHTNSKLTAVDRGILLGETPVMESVFDLIPKTERDRIEATKEAINMTKSLVPPQPEPTTVAASPSTPSQQVSRPVESKAKQDEVSSAVMATDFLSRFKPATLDDGAKEQTQQQQSDGQKSEISKPKAPLFQGGLSFQPFRKNPEKQQRYDQYLALLKQGIDDPYNSVAPATMTEWERARERDEFSKAAKMYRPMSAMMSSRFVTGSMIDDDLTETPLDSGSDQTDEAKAAEMKMFGKLTREEFEWHPHQLLCRRFNVPNPYPWSDIVGVPGVKRDKYSVFNFLSMGDFRSGETQEPSRVMKESTDKEGCPERSMETSKPKKTTMASVFKVLDDPNFNRPTSSQSKDQTGPSQMPTDAQGSSVESETETMKEEEAATDMDLFRAIFKNSDSEDEDEEEEERTGDREEEDKSSDEGKGSGEEGGETSNVPGLGAVTSIRDVAEPTVVKTEVMVDTATEGRPHPFHNLFARKKKESNESPPIMSEGQEAKNQVKQSTTSLTAESLPSSVEASKKSHEYKSRWGGKSVFSALDDMEDVPGNTKEATSNPSEAGFRLALEEPKRASQETIASDRNSEEEASYGPSLPPSLLSAAALAPVSESEGRGRPSERQQHRKESRSSHRKEKKKKSKHTKEEKHRKHKKSRKSRSKSRKRPSSSGSEADTESDSAESVPDSELLQRLKEVSKANKSSLKNSHM